MSKILEHLVAIYGSDIGRATFTRYESLRARYRSLIPAPHAAGLTERDAILITYGDQIREPNVPPLQTLADFCVRHLTGVVTGIHILPFYPYSSDDGFAVMDYRAVNPALGDWDDVARLGERFRLMFDAVINHVSSQSAWFRGLLRGDPRYSDYFIVVPTDADLSAVVRPRTSPLLTAFRTPSGDQRAWTTFGPDQIDLNYRNPDVLLEIVETLLFYIAHGADLIRLDAIAFLWKEIGTSCLHLPQTHHIIQLLRAIVDDVAPGVWLITETNVPHVENVAYFGDGTNEAHLVYNFALPPLTLHAFQTGDARTLSRWARGLTLPSKHVTFFNFLASHDGIGLNPARGMLSDEEIDSLVVRTQQHGGLVSYKSNVDGGPSPYELNITFFDALSDPNGNEMLGRQVDRFITAHAIMLALVGVPGIYFHSLFGSRSWPAGVAQTGQNRTINREKVDRSAFEREFADGASRRRRVFAGLGRLLHARAAHRAFNPFGEMRVVEAGPSVLAILRFGSGSETVLCLHNVSGKPTRAALDLSSVLETGSANVVDVITDEPLAMAAAADLAPYQTRWLMPLVGQS